MTTIKLHVDRSGMVYSPAGSSDLFLILGCLISNIVFSRRSIWVLLELIRRWTQHFTKINQEKRKIEQICIWNPMTTGFIM